MQEIVNGKIVKGIGGFYYIETADGIYECKAKGVLRKDHKKPLVGDNVTMEVLDREAKLGNLADILPRKNELLRPAVANVDQALIIFAVASPQPPLNLVDRMLILLENQGLPCAVCFNKADLDEGGMADNFRRIYELAGYRVFVVSARDKVGISEVKEFLHGKTTTVAGPSGVGKSSLINLMAGREVMATGDISEKIERGKHTTRHSELFSIDCSDLDTDLGAEGDLNSHTHSEKSESFILDTPGFSSLELYMAGIEKEDLWSCYPEFIPEEPNCKFAGCAHIHEPKCGIKQAVEEGRIARERYENYCQLYEGLAARRKY